MLKFPHHVDFIGYQPGQFYFINIPEISLNQWHPFTASAIVDTGLVFFIKKLHERKNNQDDSTLIKRRFLPVSKWTRNLATQSQKDPFWRPLVRLHGPFGHNDFFHYETLLLFAGGIGITPLIAIFTDLRKKAIAGDESLGNLKTVVLVWMSRSISEFRMFEELFAVLIDENLRFKKEGKTESSVFINIKDKNETSLGKVIGERNSPGGSENPRLLTDKSNLDSRSQLNAHPITINGPLGDTISQTSQISSTSVDEASIEDYPSSPLFEAPSPNMEPPAFHFGKEAGESTTENTSVNSKTLEPNGSTQEFIKRVENDETSKAETELHDSNDFSTGKIGQCTFDLRLHCTERDKFQPSIIPNILVLDENHIRLLMKQGRCDLKSIFSKHVNKHTPQTTLAAVCGPHSLMYDVSMLAWRFKCDFHSEQFNW